MKAPVNSTITTLLRDAKLRRQYREKLRTAPVNEDGSRIVTLILPDGRKVRLRTQPAEASKVAATA